jgi:hypothetical protein
LAANTDPIYSRSPDVQSSALIAAVNAVLYNAAGTIGTDVYKIWTADATNGGFLQRVRVKYVANATTTSVACVMKFFLTAASSGAVTDTTSWLIDEIAIPATGTLTTTAAPLNYDVAMNIAVPAGWSVVCKITVAQPASCGFIATGFGGKY